MTSFHSTSQVRNAALHQTKPTLTLPSRVVCTTEHADLVNRRLHVIGTTIVLLITAFFPSMAVNAVAAAALGVAVQVPCLRVCR